MTDSVELDLLDSNLNTISNELNSLLLGGDTSGGDADGGADVSMYWNQNQQQFEEVAAGSSPYEIVTNLTATFVATKEDISDTRNNAIDQSYMDENFSINGRNNPVFPSYAAAPNAAGTPPTFEFHYLRSKSFNKSVQSREPIPLISTATASRAMEPHQYHQQRHQRCGQGAYKKYNYHNKYNSKPPRSEFLHEEVDDENFKVDLEKIGIPADGKERNPILRLFLRFRKLNHYLHDKFPFGILVADEPVDIRPIPYTMNVQYQVKYAARNCTIFICDMERILNANKLYDRQIYAECEISIQALRKTLAQIEVYKRIDLEHKRGQFVTEEARAQAERLELLMKHLCDQIRECNLHVHVFNWAVENKMLPQGADSDQSQMYINPAEQIQMIAYQNAFGDGYELKNSNKASFPRNQGTLVAEPMRYIGSYYQ